MTLISWDEQKAIDISQISYFFITKTLDGWNLIVMPKGQSGNWEWSALIFFRHTNKKIVTTMLRYLQLFLISQPTNLLKVDIPTFYSFGMAEFAPALLADNLETEFEKPCERPENQL